MIPVEGQPEPEFVIRKYLKFHSYDSDYLFANGLFLGQFIPPSDLVLWRMDHDIENTTEPVNITSKFDMETEKFGPFLDIQVELGRDSFQLLLMDNSMRSTILSSALNLRRLTVKGGLTEDQLKRCLVVFNDNDPISVSFDQILLGKESQQKSDVDILHIVGIMVVILAFITLIMAFLFFICKKEAEEKLEQEEKLYVDDDLVKVAKWRGVYKDIMTDIRKNKNGMSNMRGNFGNTQKAAFMEYSSYGGSDDLIFSGTGFANSDASGSEYRSSVGTANGSNLVL